MAQQRYQNPVQWTVRWRAMLSSERGATIVMARTAMEAHNVFRRRFSMREVTAFITRRRTSRTYTTPLEYTHDCS